MSIRRGTKVYSKMYFFNRDNRRIHEITEDFERYRLAKSKKITFSVVSY